MNTNLEAIAWIKFSNTEYLVVIMKEKKKDI